MELTAHFTARTDDNHAAPVVRLYLYFPLEKLFWSNSLSTAPTHTREPHLLNPNLYARNGKIMRGLSN